MLKKKLGIEAIEKDWYSDINLTDHFKIPSPLIIPENVERIGIDAFCCYRKLKKVVIPSSVKWIRDYAFWGCEKAVIILKKPKSEFKFIALNAFQICKDVKEEVRG